MDRRVDIERLIRDIVGLRRVELNGGSDEVGDVRVHLEEIVGATVGRATSARVLGVTQSALDRHVSRGAISAVITPSGRREIPLRELVALMIARDQVLQSGRVVARPLSTALRMRRVAALTLDRATVLGDAVEPERINGSERRGLAYHRAVAARLDEQLIRDARRRLSRWTERENIDERWARQWEEILSLPVGEIQRVITTIDARGRDLRQSSPFAGALGHEERRRVLELVAEAT